MGPSSKEGSSSYSGRKGKTMVHSYTYAACAGSCAYDDERGRIQVGTKQFRADILVYDRQAKPLMIVECKRPEVELTSEVLDQTIRYNMVLNVKYILITNGNSTYICQRTYKEEKVRYVFINDIPKYNEMLR